jgi:HAD superfamily hydrolase (TIGR01509 family)
MNRPDRPDSVFLAHEELSLELPEETPPDDVSALPSVSDQLQSLEDIIVSSDAFELLPDTKGVIFDFDGTIAFTRAAHVEPPRMAIEDIIGRKFSTDEWIELYKQASGHHELETCRRLLEVVCTAFPDNAELKELTPQEMADLKLQYFLDNFEELKPYLIDGVADLIERIQNSGRILSLCSNSRSEFVEAVLSHYGLGDTFAFKTFSNEVPIDKGKPHPLLYLKTAEKMGLEPADLAAFEDTFHGALSAWQAGLQICARVEERFEKMFHSQAAEYSVDQIVVPERRMPIVVVSDWQHVKMPHSETT